MEEFGFYEDLFKEGLVRCISHYCSRKWYPRDQGYAPNPYFEFCSRECYVAFCKRIGVDEKLLEDPVGNARG